MRCKVELSKSARKDLDNVPLHIRLKLLGWVDEVQNIGIRETRKILGFHDEPLKGERIGQRSIRLNKAYRAIYVEIEKDKFLLLSVIEVNKHEY